MGEGEVGEQESPVHHFWLAPRRQKQLGEVLYSMSTAQEDGDFDRFLTIWATTYCNLNAA
jgi:hypothetical protein